MTLDLNHNVKAGIVSAFFLIAGFAAWRFIVPDPSSGTVPATALPLFIFYLTIVVNTFFSIRLFTQIIPKEDFTQKCFDVALVLVYLWLAYAMKNVLLFAFVDTLLFIIAAGKYAGLLRIVHHPILLKRKILIDLVGALAGLLAIGGIILGYPLETAWTLALAKVVANIALLYFWPMYRLDSDK
jgi:hypothetical protein